MRAADEEILVVFSNDDLSGQINQVPGKIATLPLNIPTLKVVPHTSTVVGNSRANAIIVATGFNADQTQRINQLPSNMPNFLSTGAVRTNLGDDTSAKSIVWYDFKNNFDVIAHKDDNDNEWKLDVTKREFSSTSGS